jgi:hypothetical protein
MRSTVLRLTLFAALTTLALGVFGLMMHVGVVRADPPTFHNVPANKTVAAGPSDTVTLTWTAISVTDDDNDNAFSCTATNGATSMSGFVSGGTFKLGTTTVTCHAPDEPENPPEDRFVSFTVTVSDQTPVFSGVPGPITVNATSPAGATVTYTAPTAAEPGETGETNTVTCLPGAGSIFAIGTTTVHCTAANPDAPTATASTTFTVKVKSAVEQLHALLAFVTGKGPGTSLQDKVHAVLDSLAAGDTAGACGTLTALIHEASAQSGKHLTVAEATQISVDATRIQGVIPC